RTSGWSVEREQPTRDVLECAEQRRRFARDQGGWPALDPPDVTVRPEDTELQEVSSVRRREKSLHGRQHSGAVVRVNGGKELPRAGRLGARGQAEDLPRRVRALDLAGPQVDTPTREPAR